MEDIKKIFHIKKVNDHEEILMVLLNYFGHSEMIETWGYRFQKKEQINFLDVYLNNNGLIKEISMSKGFPEDELCEIEYKIVESLIKNQQNNIGQTVDFLYEAVKGYYKYGDVFQITPVPDFAPKPKVAFADHPFLLQFKYVGSVNNFVDARRKQEMSDIIIRLLNLFSDTWIHSRPRFAEFTWSYMSQEPNDLSSEWTQVGYFYKGFSGKIDDYSTTDSLTAIELVPSKQYYSEPRPIRFQPIKLPDNIDKSLDIVFGLNDKEFEKLYRACYWYYLASDVWLKSNSLSYISLICALESLMDKLNKGDYCDSCGNPMLRLSERFRKLLERYVPTLDNYIFEKKLLYEISSKLLHGSSLLGMDLNPLFSMFNIKALEQRDVEEKLKFITKIAIINWVLDKA